MELHYVYKMYRFANKVSQKVVPLRVYPWPRTVEKLVHNEHEHEHYINADTRVIKKQTKNDYKNPK